MHRHTLRLSALLFGLLTSLSLHAQLGDLRNNFSIGFGGGINMSSVSFNPSVKQNSLSGIQGGLCARYISERWFKMLCGAQVEINFSQRGWSEIYKDYPTLVYQRKMNYMEIPFLAHLAFGKEKGLQFFVHLGPQIGFFLSDSETQSGDWNAPANDNINIETTQHSKPLDTKFDYGIVGGGGIELRTKIGNFQAEGRYYYALSDFFDNTKKGYFGRSAHNVIGIRIAYLFDLTK